MSLIIKGINYFFESLILTFTIVFAMLGAITFSFSSYLFEPNLLIVKLVSILSGFCFIGVTMNVIEPIAKKLGGKHNV